MEVAEGSKQPQQRKGLLALTGSTKPKTLFTDQGYTRWLSTTTTIKGGVWSVICLFYCTTLSFFCFDHVGATTLRQPVGLLSEVRTAVHWCSSSWGLQGVFPCLDKPCLTPPVAFWVPVGCSQRAQGGFQEAYPKTPNGFQYEALAHKHVPKL